MLLLIPLSILSTYLVPIIPTIASLINHTIDDEFGDSVTGVVPTYYAGAHWQTWTQGQNCTGCSFTRFNVNVSRVFNGSWHSVEHIPGYPASNITASMSGIAIYVFNLIALQTPTNLTFYLDGEVADTFFHPIHPNGVMGVQYRVPVFSKTGLSNGPHTLEIVSGGPTLSLTLFDYIEYTVDDDSRPSLTNTSSQSPGPSAPTTSMHAAPSTQDSHTSAVATSIRLGSAVGGGAAAIVSVLAITAYLIRRRRRAQLSPLRRRVEKLLPHEDVGVDGAGRGKPAEGARHPSSAPSCRLSRPSTAPALVGFSTGRSELDELCMAASSTLRIASRSDCTAVLGQRIQGLEAQARELSRQVPATSSESGSLEVNFFGGRGDDGTQKVDAMATKEEGVERDAEEERSTEVSGSTSVIAELAFLRHEIATLRGQMERIQRSEDQLPPYSM